MALMEMVSFDDAIKVSQDMTSSRDTLSIVTADHGHTLTHGGAMDRGSFILGKSSQIALDRKPYTALLYGNGPGYNESPNDFRQLLNPFRVFSDKRENITDVNTGAQYKNHIDLPTLYN